MALSPKISFTHRILKLFPNLFRHEGQTGYETDIWCHTGLNVKNNLTYAPLCLLYNYEHERAMQTNIRSDILEYPCAIPIKLTSATISNLNLPTRSDFHRFSFLSGTFYRPWHDPSSARMGGTARHACPPDGSSCQRRNLFHSEIVE